MLTRHMCRTLLLVICSTSTTLANVTDSTLPSEPTSNLKLTTINETHSQYATITAVNLTLDMTKLNHSDALTTTEGSANILLKIHRTVTRSKDAVWATVSLTFICVLLLLAVAQSRMWKDYRVTESQGVPLPDFNERVLFRDVMEHKLKSLKRIFKKQKKKNTTEMESLLASSELDEEDIP